MDNENLEEQKKQEAGQKTAHVAGKAAATALGGAAGAKAYDLASQTAVGKELEKAAGNRIQNNPVLNKASEKLNDSKALDAIDKGIDLGNKSKDSKQLTKNNLSNKNNGSPESNDESQTETKGINSSVSKKKLIPIVASIGGIGCFGGILAIVFIAIIMAATGIIDVAKNFINGIVDFFTDDQQELEEKYYKKLQSTQVKINEKYGVCIDINLITASLIVETTVEDFLNNGEIEIDSTEDEETDAEESTDTDYKRMTKQIELLARMQIMNKKYSLDKDYKSTTGSYCSSTSSEKLVDSTNQSSFDKGIYEWLNSETDLDSSNFEKIASHDMGNFLSFFTKKINEENNYAYYLYYPVFDADGNCSDNYAKDMLPEDTPILSIGDYATREESVFYWNLINSFIPEYYEDYLPDKSNSEYNKKVKELADQIYSLYDTYGPSQTCSITQKYQGPSSLCPGGITVVNKDGDGAVIDFEEYIAGVVSKEAYSSEGMEALKAQAVAARTYALKKTNYCETSISNSTSAQTFTRDINDRAREATQATAGEILVDSSGNIFSAQYDSFCYDDEDCPDAKKNADGTYSVTYTKVPSGEKHIITLSDSSQYGRITHGQGHAHGMSQLLSYQLAKEGKTYKEILSYFYSDGVTISLVLSPTTTEGGIIIDKPIEHYLSEVGTNINEMNQAIFTQVKKAGVGTREGVVAAAVTLINNFYTQTGYLLPYELYTEGKYKGYGMDPNWGTSQKRTDYPVNGLDCSGYISWAIHNGGFAYVTKSAKGWGDAGISRAWSKGMTDSSAQPGDLIYNAPQSENGTTGHIRMIVDVTKDGYVVAEASGRKNGLRITTISFTSTNSYYLIDMSNYYATATKVTDYPQ